MHRRRRPPGRRRLHGRARAARAAEEPGDHHRGGVRGEEEADPRNLGREPRRAGTETVRRRSRPGRRDARGSCAVPGCPERASSPEREDTDDRSPARARPAPRPHDRARDRAGRVIAARILVVIGILVTRRQPARELRQARGARPRPRFARTSKELIANDEIRNQVAAVSMVDAALRRTSTWPPKLQNQLPNNLKRHLRADRRAPRVSSRTEQLASCWSDRAVQQLFVNGFVGRSGAVHRRCSRAIRQVRRYDKQQRRPRYPAARARGWEIASSSSSNLANRVPQDSAQVTIIESDDLDHRAEHHAVA